MSTIVQSPPGPLGSLGSTMCPRCRRDAPGAIMGLARARGGVLTATEVAESLRLSTQDADAFLTELAKRGDGKTSLEVEEDGRLVYLFPDYAPANARTRFAVEPASRARIDA